MAKSKSTILQVVYGFSPDHVIIKNGFYDTLKVLQHNGNDVVFFSRELGVSEKKLSLHGGFYEKFQIFRGVEKCLRNDYTDDRFGSFLDRIAPDVVHFHSFESFSLGMVNECKKRNIPVFLSIYEGSSSYVTKDWFSFSNFLNAKKEALPNHIYMSGSDSNHCLIMHPNSKITFRKMSLKIGDKIKFVLSVSPDVIEKVNGIVQFRIFSGEKVIFCKKIDTKNLKADMQFEVIIDEDRKEALVFETKAISECCYCNVGWKDICLEQKVENLDENITYFKLFTKIIVEHSHLYEKYKKLDVPDSILYKNTTTSVEKYAEMLEKFYNEYSRQADGFSEAPICSELKKYKVSIVMPTYNGEEFLENVLEIIKNQKTDFSFELIVVDSGSTDRTIEIIKHAEVPNCSFYTIKKGTFNHGLTRNFGVSKSCGEIVVLLTQDAVPVDKNWLANIVNSYKNESVVALYVRQIPRDNCNLIIGRRVDTGFTGLKKSYLTDVCDFETYDSLSPFEKYKLTNFDDVCSSFRRSFWEKNPYKKTNFAEDLRFGIDVVLSGERIFYNAETAVVHSHDYSFSDAYKRFYVSFLVLLEFYDLANVRGIRELFRLVFSSVKSDVKFICTCRISLWSKLYYFYFLFFFNILTGLAQFMAYHDFQKGKIKT